MGKRRRTGSNASINSGTGTTTLPASSSQASSEMTSAGARGEVVQPQWIREKKGLKGEREERGDLIGDKAVSNGTNGRKDIAGSSSLSISTSTTPSSHSIPLSRATNPFESEQNDHTRASESEIPEGSDFEDCSEGDLSNPSTPTDTLFPLTRFSSLT